MVQFTKAKCQSYKQGPNIVPTLTSA
ncbi:hypothetical protein CCACVL1_04483 [Corchorus capsularis]|uniref:Uncharacterized protein n=1 Tax=Corchorus capsularis TaxID=210143 RepID=A0A1R3JSC7_COCAP|nr:hypothetical protein CCACVL1_04483 [Corchorus capsularis]